LSLEAKTKQDTGRILFDRLRLNKPFFEAFLVFDGLERRVGTQAINKTAFQLVTPMTSVPSKNAAGSS
jgi:hypothetical protein